MDEPLSPDEVRRLLRAIVATGDGPGLRFTRHAETEMAGERPPMNRLTVRAAVLGGVVEPGEMISGTWRYRIRTQTGTHVVVAFRSESEAVVVTVWRA